MIQYPIDLHLHSRFSDGLYTPEALCSAADNLGLRAVALCDHDTLDGLAPMAEAVAAVNSRRRSDSSLILIPSIELSAGQDGRVHVLGYGVNARDAALAACLSAAQNDRETRAAQMLNRLEAVGVHLPPEARAALCRPTVGRAHIARALVAHGMVNTVTQAFDRYLAQGKCAYVPWKPLKAADAVALLKNAGASPVLAHPRRLPLGETALLALVEELADAGLQGLEVYHPSASRSAVRMLESYARRSGLMVTGGSDFHGDPNTSVSIAHMPSGWQSWHEDLQALLKCAGQA